MESNLKDLKIVIDDMLTRSESRLRAAKLLMKGKLYEDVVSRAYYAMFYLIEAMLLTKDLASSKHSGVMGFFNHYFIKVRNI
ncbi:MAG: HEPN domain-containing protein [bacterium]